MCGENNTHEDGTSLDGQHLAADDDNDDNDQQEVRKGTCTGTNADLIKG